jgi:hypothetical protein
MRRLYYPPRLKKKRKRTTVVRSERMARSIQLLRMWVDIVPCRLDRGWCSVIFFPDERWNDRVDKGTYEILGIRISTGA